MYTHMKLLENNFEEIKTMCFNGSAIEHSHDNSLHYVPSIIFVSFV